MRLHALPLFVCLLVASFAQPTANPSSAVPSMVSFNGILRDTDGTPLTGTIGVTFSLYQDAQGGSPLWLETQNVQLDKTGHYSVMLGSTTAQGLPTELFSSSQAKWLGVQPQGRQEQPRVLLLAVPYALKAADADTVGGKPVSAFVLANPQGTPAKQSNSPSSPTAITPNYAGSGTSGYIPEWRTSSTIGNSRLFQSSSGNLGMNTTTPSQVFEVDSGNALIRGPHNFSAAGDTAFLYIGDTNHPIEAAFKSGLSLGAFKAPQALFIADFTGNVGIGTTSTTGAELTSVSNAAATLGLSVTGYSAALNSNGSGVDAFHATGGNGDPNNQDDGGNAIVANGGSGNNGESSGAGVVATGGSSDIYTNGGDGVYGAGGAGIGGGSGGYFIGAGGRYSSGPGVFGLSAGNVSPLNGAVFFGSTDPDDAAFFNGDIYATGVVYGSAKDFRIDHPLDPTNKYLQHTAVESSEMKNIYDGVALLDGNGEVTVQLPSWFEALNGDFRYQLTAIGRPGPGLYIAQEISGNRFRIAGGTAGAKISWMVTGIRHDAYAAANPLVVEADKIPMDRGYYLHPELYGAPPEQGIEWGRMPRLAKRAKEIRAKAAQRAFAQTTHAPSLDAH